MIKDFKLLLYHKALLFALEMGSDSDKPLQGAVRLFVTVTCLRSLSLACSFLLG